MTLRPESGSYLGRGCAELYRKGRVSANRLPSRLVAYLETLPLVGGDRGGELFEVLAWERKFIRGAFGQPGDAALSVARGNGKSALVAGLGCAVIDPEGPLHGSRREVLCVASSFQQGRVVYEDVLAMLRAKTGLDLHAWRLQDSANSATVEHRASGARVRCIGSDPRRAHGLRPFLALLDEPAQWDAAKADRMLAALRTGLGKVPGSKLIALGTRPIGEDHWFSRLLREAAYAQIHAARPTDPPFQLSTIRRSNPSLDHLPSLRERLEVERAEAKRDETLLPSWLGLRLNLGVAEVLESRLLEADTWEAAEADVAPEGEYILGVDLGATAAMSAACAYYQNGRVEAFAAFPEVPDLAERGRRDGVGPLYQRMRQRGELIHAGEFTSDVRALLAEVLERWGPPAAVVADRWREGELREALDAAGVPPAELELRGQGFRDGGEDVRDFRRAVLDGRARPVESLLLRAAMAEARVLTDPAGNQKLSKSTQGGRRLKARDDAAAAAILAVAAGERRFRVGAPESRLLLGVA